MTAAPPPPAAPDPGDGSPPRGVDRLVLRTLEAAAAALLLLALAPLLALIALAIRLESKGPVLTRHRAREALGRPVDLLAFRTAASDEPCTDPRPTRIGRALRRTGLDQLPGLWNVLRGDVGLLGRC